MKILLATVLALLAPQTATQAQNISPASGCVWNENRGSCMVANPAAHPVTCDVRVQVTTARNQKTTKLNGVVIEAGASFQTPQFRSSWGDPIEKAQVASRCK
jgi:hypothetical protein